MNVYPVGDSDAASLREKGMDEQDILTAHLKKRLQHIPPPLFTAQKNHAQQQRGRGKLSIYADVYVKFKRY